MKVTNITRRLQSSVNIFSLIKMVMDSEINIMMRVFMFRNFDAINNQSEVLRVIIKFSYEK